MWLFRDKLNNKNIALFRFADDCIIFANSLETVDTIINKVNEFLTPRGLEVNLNKTKIRHLHKQETFKFVGYEYATSLRHGKWRIYNFLPMNKFLALKQKVDKVLKTYKSKPYIAFYLVNAIIRGWCTYYSFSNSKDIFSNLRHWLWHRIYRYLFKF